MNQHDGSSMNRLALAAALLVASGLAFGAAPPGAGADPSTGCSYQLPQDPAPNAGLTDETRDFAQSWFDALSRHAPLDEVLGYLDPHSLVMSFPDPVTSIPSSVCDEDGFRQWYRKAGDDYSNQHHEIVSFDAGGSQDKPVVHLSVAWSGTDAKTGEPFQYTANQEWALARGGPDGFLIQAYIVSGLTPQ